MRGTGKTCLGLVLAALAATPVFGADGTMKSDASPALAPAAYAPLPLGSVRGAGWLQRQLRIQADGLSGHLEEFWPDIKDSGWIGGKAEGWERAPYWLDGFTPLAYTLDDAKLKETVQRWMDHILTHQHEDGWLGPFKSEGYKDYDVWPQFIILKALRQYAEASGDDRVIPAMLRCSKKIDQTLAARPLFDWGKYRWMDFALVAQWLYEQTGEAWLLDAVKRAHDQGFDWRGHFENFKFKEKMAADKCILDTHVVNNAMAMKASGVWYRQSRDAADAAAPDMMMRTLDTYHGQVTGILTGDEHYAGNCPSQGTECCAVVEYMFSLETLLSVLGEPAFGDRLERIAFNALPGTFDAVMWRHQYVQQANQAQCRLSVDRIYTNNGPDANLFGLEPNYGCCTANFSQGWPKFTAHLWMKSPAAEGVPEGLAAVAWAPCTVDTTLGEKPVHVEVRTDYPFRDSIEVMVRADGNFPVRLRVPAWAEGATLEIAGEPAVPMASGAFHTVDRVWQGDTVLRLKFPMTAKVERRYNISAAVSRGPLVYSLQIGSYWKHLRGEAPHDDFEVFPTTPWNYALQLDASDPAKSLRFGEGPVGDSPFDPATPPVHALVQGRLLPDWTIEHNAAAPPPQSPVVSTQPLVDLTLVPYGIAKLRITEFPVLAE